MTIVIPAYNPDYHLIEVLKDLKKEIKSKIIVVNDGSDKEKNKIFKEAEDYALILTHEINKGKGSAMKTALQYIKDNNYEGGVIFVDADGQHKVNDVKKIINAFESNKDALIIGTRVFDADIPIKSKLGNKITRLVFKIFTGTYVSDTQTGLRMINTKYISFLLSIEGNRYEYEMNMLVKVVRKKIKIVEVPIETIYEDKKNSTSHFRAFRDSFLIYKVFFKFSASSIFSAVVDYFMFILFTNTIGKFGYMLILSNILARVISGTVNYNINKKLVFKSKKNVLLKYTMLAIFIIIMNSVLLYMLTLCHIIPAIAKIIVEVSMFIISYKLQEKVIFNDGGRI